jgi:hypothetical protein
VYQFPCPHCAIVIETNKGATGKHGPCPHCNKRVYLLDTDDLEPGGTFAFVRWVPCNDERSSKAHLQLAKSGLGKQGFFLKDDPAIEGWWVARRKGLRPCRCEFISVDELDAAELKLPRKCVKPLPFDPWSPEDDCELIGWGSERSKYDDEDYADHSGNPDLKEAKTKKEMAPPVEADVVWPPSNPTSLPADPKPTGVLAPTASLEIQPPVIPAAEILPENLPGDGTGGMDRGATASTILTASAYLEPSQIQNLAALMPRLLEIKADSNVPLQFLVQVELGDGQSSPSKEVASKVTQILSAVSDKLLLRKSNQVKTILDSRQRNT